MEYSELDLAYMAGLVDGEAHIGVHRTQRATDGGLQYMGRISLRMTDKSIIEEFAFMFGLKARAERNYSPLGRRMQWSAEAAGRSSLPVLNTLIPHLRLKREQAQICVKLEALKKRPGIRTRETGYVDQERNGKTYRRRTYSISQEIMDEMESMYQRVKLLNKPLV